MTMEVPSKIPAFFGYAIRAVVVLAYTVWVFGGFCILHHKQVDPVRLQYIATRNLPVGHRLHPGDFTFKPPVPMGERRLLPPESDPVGKYLLQAREKDKPIGFTDLSAVPVIQVSADKLKYFFPLQNQMDLSDILNTDSRVDVCATTCVIENARVVSIVCGGTPSRKCSAVLELSKQDAAGISGQGKDDYCLVQRGDSGR